MTTIADVAARAGVGIGTVSRVLNGSSQVRPETRARVQDAMDELDYQPSRVSRRARRGHSGYVGVLVHFFEGPSAYQRLRGMVTRLQPHGFEVVLFIVDSPERARERLAELPHNQQLDGLIIMSLPLRADEGQRLAGARFPTVLIDTVHPALPSVTIDDHAGGMMATNHLLDLGHERVAFVGEPHRNPFGFIASRFREEGYKEALATSGIEHRTGYIKHGPHLRSGGRQMATELFALDEPPTAIVAASDLQAIGVLEAARAAGRAIPHDLSVIGFDDIEMASYVGLSTVRQPLELSGQRGADLILGAISQGVHTSTYKEQLALELVIRTTTGAAPNTNGHRRRRAAPKA
ncbi:MAG: LacI family DNA-binding transcriptional regulator [Acidimicrobiia bacterium]